MRSLWRGWLDRRRHRAPAAIGIVLTFALSLAAGAAAVVTAPDPAPSRAASSGVVGRASPPRPAAGTPARPGPARAGSSRPGVATERRAAPDAGATFGSPPPTGEGGPVAYRPPVRAPVTDPFRAPEHPYGPGNRGIEYTTTPGTPVRSAGRGRVTFAGPVAGSLHVTVTHPDGIRTSYSYLDEIRVAGGQRLDGGTVVGIAGDRFHVGARRGESYLDPASLWGGPPTASVLVPLDGGRSGPG